MNASAPPPHQPLDHAGIRSIVIGIMVAMFLASLDQTIIATALPTIGRAFGDVEHLSWIVTVYLLASTAVTPLYGKLSDIHGRRTMMLIGLGVFLAGSVACALAPNLLVLILARGLQGLGGGGLISLAQTIIADAVAPRDRGRYQALIGSVFVASSIAGPVLGGFFAEKLHWSLIFWINLPLGVVALMMTNAALQKLPQYHRAHRLDLVGAALMVGATVLLLLALSWTGTRYAFFSPVILGLLGVSIALWVLFALRILTAPEPFLPLAVMRDRVVRCATTAVMFAMGAMVALSIYVPLYFELVRGLSASLSGLALIPFVGLSVIGAITAGRLAVTLTHYKRPVLVGIAGSMLCLGIIAFDPAGLPLPVVVALLGLGGIGLGTIFPVTTVATQNAVLQHQMGTTTGLIGFLRAVGSAVTVAAYGAIVLGASGVDAGVSIEMLHASGTRQGVDLAHGFRWMFIAAVIGLAIAFVLLWVMEERPLRGGPKPQEPKADEPA